jgi:hypothetical protein
MGTQDTGHRTQDAGRRTQDAGRRVQRIEDRGRCEGIQERLVIYDLLLTIHYWLNSLRRVEESMSHGRPFEKDRSSSLPFNRGSFEKQSQFATLCCIGVHWCPFVAKNVQTYHNSLHIFTSLAKFALTCAVLHAKTRRLQPRLGLCNDFSYFVPLCLGRYKPILQNKANFPQKR